MKYTDEQRAEAIAILRANAFDFGMTSKQLDIPVRTLRHWNGGHVVVQELADKKRNQLQSALGVLAMKLITRLEKLAPKGDMRNTSIALGIVLEKYALFSGETPSGPQVNVVNIQAIDYRAGLAALAPGPIHDSNTPGEAESPGGGQALRKVDPGRLPGDEHGSAAR